MTITIYPMTDDELIRYKDGRSSGTLATLEHRNRKTLFKVTDEGVSITEQKMSGCGTWVTDKEYVDNTILTTCDNIPDVARYLAGLFQ